MSVRRIRIRADRGDEAVAVDVALPATAPVGELVPAIVELIGISPASAGGAREWRLHRLTGTPLAESSSLQDNGIHDGEMVILTSVTAPHLGVLRLTPIQEVIAARQTGGIAAPAVVGVLLVSVAAAALAWAGVDGPHLGNLMIAAAGAVAACAVSVATGYLTAPSLSAVILWATTGFLTVPSGPAAPNVLLASAAALAAALLAMRFSGRPSSALVGTATYSILLAVTTVTTLPMASAGAVLGAGALGLLALAPRLTVFATKLGPEHWAGGGVATRADSGHAVLTGLVAGCGAGAASGSALVALACLRAEVAIGGLAFPALIGLVLLLRMRSHDESSRRIPLAVAGACCGTVTFAVIVAATPDLAGWGGSGLIAVALLLARGQRFGSGVSRVADRVEYAALAAVVPLALWVGGVYGIVGGMHLP